MKRYFFLTLRILLLFLVLPLLGIAFAPANKISADCTVNGANAGSIDFLWKTKIQNEQEQGFHGRAHKQDDSCYAFWIGATLEVRERET